MIRRSIPAALLALRLALGFPLIWAGALKAAEPALFAQTVRAYEVLPLVLIHPLSIALPWMEIAAGLCLSVGLWTQSAALSALLLLLAFEAVLGVNLYRGASFSCGCFGLDGRGSSLHEALLRNVLLIGAGLVLLKARVAPLSLDLLISRRLHRPDTPPPPSSSA